MEKQLSAAEKITKLQYFFECFETNEKFAEIFGELFLCFLKFEVAKKEKLGERTAGMNLLLQLQNLCDQFLEKISSSLGDFQNYQIPEKNLENLADAEKIAAQNLVAEILANAAEIENEIENF